jgi:hypothetical protein
MFKTAKVGCYLNSFSSHGDDQDSKELRLVFHVPAIPYELAAEISPQLADRLFRKVDHEWEPSQEITKAAFGSVQVQMQNITCFELPDGLHVGGTYVPGCAISNLRAQRPFHDFRLEFDVVVPMDSSTMRLVEKYYKATVFLTMEPVQRDIEYKPEAETEATQEELQAAADETPAETEKPKRRGRKKKLAEALA